MITLVNRKIAVKPILDPDKSQGGLYIPDIAKERTDQGIVKYVGPKCKDVQVGDYVLFSGYTGTTVQFEQDGDGVLIIFDERFVVCKLDNPDTNVNGLFFRAALDKAEEEEFDRKLEFILDDNRCVNVPQVMQQIRNEFAKRESNRYFSATYEMAMNLIAESFRHTEFAKGVGIKNPLGAKTPFEDDIEFDDDD